ncbi:hypothetical protein F4680DRAFT_460403 [Xylaria scruposa]|nr:hypothetical protein F4680DRAFT_460403 [Xylaria scruposa]
MHLTQPFWDDDIVGQTMATFTALNGGDSKTSDGASGSPITRHGGTEDRSSIQSQEAKSGDASVTKVEPSSGSSLERSHYPSRSYAEIEGTHKRKRSLSVERPREVSNVQDQEQRSQAESRGAYEVSSRERDYRHYGEDQREQGEPWYSQQQSRDDRSLYESRGPAGSDLTQTDEQGGDTLRRATSHADSAHDYSATSPDGDESSMLYSGAYSQDQSRDPVIQSDPKKRKRNFSNRTKTGKYMSLCSDIRDYVSVANFYEGCLTCRKRKKKCDESKPECTNCVRGGFVCYGYPNQRGPPRTENKPAAVPLESKDPSYVPPGAYGMPQPSNYLNPPPAPAPKRDSVSSYRGPYLRLETSQARSTMTDDDRPTASTIPTASVVSSVMSPDNKGSAFSAYSSAANMFPTPISAITPSMQQLKTPNIERPREYQRVPPLHDITRTEPDSSRPETPRPGSLPQMNVLEPTPPTVSGTQPPPSADPQIAAQLALSHSQYPPNNNKPRTQKEEMLLGREYYPFDPELVLERQRCSAACWRFNNSTNPNTGVSATERSRLFREILNPREPINLSPQLVSSTTRAGRVGQEVVVEAPFTCDYGYNITIGNNVMIGRNCTILDPVEINIGDNVIISPNVTLLGATTFTDPKKRMGSKSPQIGGYIIIDEDVFIGAGAIIQHGIRIGRGASISAGAVVVKVSCGSLALTIS